ncbi:MAG: hypothetical protein U9R27_03855 [Campylobacterota bacterium]|nr:hypothetical protein [Campylobacterota bacterium]
MKKIALASIITLLIGFIMMGCGSNTKTDPLPPPPPASPYMLTNVTTPFDIGYAGEQKEFQVQVLKDGYPISGESVNIGYLPANFGFVDSATAISNEAGYAIFNYTAADPLTNGVQSLELIHESIKEPEEGDTEEDIEILTTIAYLTINVVEGSSEFGYKFVNATTPINVTGAGQSSEISAYLMDKDNVLLPGKLVSMTPMDPKYGSITSLTTFTDGSGKASFNYTAPADLTGLGSTSVVMSCTEFGQTITQKIDIIFERTGYRFINVTTPIVINQGVQTAVISANLIDENNQGVPGETVNITPVANGYGMVTPGSTTTDNAGKAIFNYEAPLHLTGLTSTSVTMSYFDGVGTVSANVEIQITGGGDTGYQLVNAKDPYYVYAADQTETFDIQLIKNGQPVLDARTCSTDTSTVTKDCVIPYAIDRRFGRFQGIGASSGDGYLHYGYVAPDDAEKAANGEDTTFLVKYIDENGMVAVVSDPITLRMRY